jgi:NAD+ kinase
VTVVAFVVHEGRPAAVAAADEVMAELTAQGIDIAGPDASRADLVVSVGGDGTFLRGALVAYRVEAPVVGVKVGRLGFLTEAEPQDASSLILAALAGRAPVDDRLALLAEPISGVAFEPQWGMNEVMVEKRARHRLVRLRVSVDGSYVTTFSADGVIVATPTGSTAYSFSARGPIVSPGVEALVLTAVAPHMVFDRSIVLGADQVVTLEVVGDEPCVLSGDGRGPVELPIGSVVRIRAAERRVRFILRPDAPSFLSRVRDKFDLPGDPLGP